MRILFESYYCDPHLGSEHAVGWHWPTGVAALGHEVTILTLPRNKGSIEEAILGQGVSNVTVEYVLPPSVPANFPRAYGWVYVLWLRNALAAARKLGSFDVVHHVSWGHLFTGTHLWKLGFPTVIGPCGGAQIMPKALFPWLTADRQFERMRACSVWLAERAPGVRRRTQACHVLASNTDTLDAAKSLGAKSVRMMLDYAVAPEMILPSPPTKKSQGATTEIVWLGRMMPRKGAELAVSAFSKVRGNVRMCFIGDGPDRAKVARLARELGCSDRTQFLGQIPHEQAIARLRQSDIFLFTSLRESGGAPLYEAMAASLPIVTLDLHGSSLIVEPTAGIKVPVISGNQVRDDIGSALQSLVDDPDRRYRLAEGSLEAAHKNTWPVRLASAESLYNSI